MKTILVHVLNFSSNFSSSKLKELIGNFNKILRTYGIEGIEFIINDKHYLKLVKRIIDETPQDSPLIENVELLLELGISNKISFAIIGEQLGTLNPWGDAIDYVTVINNLSEKNIWHEISHLLGADDHYDENTKDTIEKCKSSNCIMQYGITDGSLCDRAIEEIRSHLEIE